MKKLELKSGTVLEVAEGSSKEKLVIICKKFADLDKYGGELTAEALEGATIDGEDVDEDQLMEDLIEADILDIVGEEGGFEVYTPAEAMSDTNDLVLSKGYTVLSAEVAQVPNNYTAISDEDGEKMQKLLDMLEDNDDVTDVWHNWDN